MAVAPMVSPAARTSVRVVQSQVPGSFALPFLHAPSPDRHVRMRTIVCEPKTSSPRVRLESPSYSTVAYWRFEFSNAEAPKLVTAGVTTMQAPRISVASLY